MMGNLGLCAGFRSVVNGKSRQWIRGGQGRHLIVLYFWQKELGYIGKGAEMYGSLFSWPACTSSKVAGICEVAAGSMGR